MSFVRNTDRDTWDPKAATDSRSHHAFPGSCWLPPRLVQQRSFLHSTTSTVVVWIHQRPISSWMQSTCLALERSLERPHRSTRTLQCQHHSGSPQRHTTRWHIAMDLLQSHLERSDCPASTWPKQVSILEGTKPTRLLGTTNVDIDLTINSTRAGLKAATKYIANQSSQWWQIFLDSPWMYMICGMFSPLILARLPYRQFPTQAPGRICTGRCYVVDTVVCFVNHRPNHMFTSAWTVGKFQPPGSNCLQLFSPQISWSRRSSFLHTNPQKVQLRAYNIMYNVYTYIYIYILIYIYIKQIQISALWKNYAEWPSPSPAGSYATESCVRSAREVPSVVFHPLMR